MTQSANILKENVTTLKVDAEQDGWKNNLLYIVLAIIGAGLAWLVLKDVIGKIREALNRPPSSAKDFEIDETQLSFHPNAYIQLADDMEVSMQGGGTSEQDVLDILEKLRNPHDFWKLSDTFGVRENCGVFNTGCEKLNLVQWLRVEFFGWTNSPWLSLWDVTSIGGAFAIASANRYQRQLTEELDRLGLSASQDSTT